MVPSGYDNLLRPIDPRIRPYLECLLTEGNNRMSLTNEPLQVIDLCSGCFPNRLKDVSNFDRFKLKIPYAEQILTWEVIFDSANMKEPPDFIFDSEDSEFYPPLEQINSLVCWDWQNRESLVAVISELLQHYKEYQLKRAGTNTTLQRHIKSLLAENPRDLQIAVNKGERNLGTVNILMRVMVNFSELPPYLTQGNPGEDSALLHVCFPYPESSSIQTQLYLSPRVESAFGGSSNLRIPAFQPGVLVGDYYANIKQLLKKQVQLISEGYAKKKDYITAFLGHFGRSVVEFDIQRFDKIVLLLEWNDFFFTFTVELPLYFPNELPVFIFKSVYHCQNKKPYIERHKDFPYSPRWNGTEMAKRASAFILDTIKDFQKASVNHSDR